MDNQESKNIRGGIWFKRKTYGYGWVPSTWQGWAVVAMYIFSIVNNIVFLDITSSPVSLVLLNFLPNVYISTVFLLIICYAKGEEPRWQWGEDKNNSVN